MTIELAFIMPFILFLIWNTLFLSFFAYDQALLTQGTYTTALCMERAVEGVQSKEEIYKEKMLFDVKNRIVVAAVDYKQQIGDDIAIESTLHVNGPGKAYYQSAWNASQKKVVSKYEPVAFIRNCRKAEKVLENDH